MPMLHEGVAFINADEIQRSGIFEGPVAAAREFLRLVDVAAGRGQSFALETTLHARLKELRTPALSVPSPPFTVLAQRLLESASTRRSGKLVVLTAEAEGYSLESLSGVLGVANDPALAPASDAAPAQAAEASPRPRQPVEADGGGRLMGPLTSLSHASSCPCKDWSECPPASPLAYLLTCSLTLRWGSANQATTCGQAAQTSATMPHRRLYHRRRRRRRDR